MKILLIDDHAMFREGIALLLKHLDQDVCVIQAGTCEQGFKELQNQADMDLILLDLDLPDRPGMTAIAELRERFPDMPVVVLSSMEDYTTVVDVLDRGAMGFIPKSYTGDILFGALKLILAKGIYLPPTIFFPTKPNRVFETDSKSEVRSKSPAELGLTDRQIEVLYLLLQGKSTKLICRELKLAEGTVKHHTIAVLRALNVTTRTQAVIAASQMGIRFGDLPTDQ